MNHLAKAALDRARKVYALVSEEKDLNPPSREHAGAAFDLLTDDVDRSKAIDAANHARNAAQIDHRWGYLVEETETLARELP